ncbi:hypothetical protein TWF730_010494 [Orbilia blumenaviensis]|uniref:Uncharacterized protein n=1 Tax=Orbilia blumenaviensis TaxID=1796055 RepID=A0AAV9URV9_9PEZI
MHYRYHFALPLFTTILILPSTINAYAYSFLRSKESSIFSPSLLTYEYTDPTTPKQCQRINYYTSSGSVTGLRLWTNKLLSRGPWAFLFYADSTACDHHGNLPVLVVYCNIPSEAPYTFQLADFEPLMGLMESNNARDGTIWKFKSWEEIKPGTTKWRLFIEYLNLVPGQMAFDGRGRWGDDLKAVNPRVARVKMWRTTTGRFDRPLEVLRDENLMYDALGEDEGFDRFGRGVEGGAGVIQEATERWARVFGIGNGGGGDNGVGKIGVRQPTMAKWAAIFEIDDDGMELEAPQELKSPNHRQNLEDDILSLGGTVKAEHQSNYRFPANNVKVEEGQEMISGNQEPSGPLGVKLEVQELGGGNMGVKYETVSNQAAPARSTWAENVEKIEDISEAAGSEGRPRFLRTGSRSGSERLNNSPNYGTGEQKRPGRGDWQAISDDILSRPGLGSIKEPTVNSKFTSFPMQNIPGLGNLNRGFLKGMSENIQWQFALADQGILDLGRNQWNWRDPDEMGQITEELTLPSGLRRHTAERRRKENKSPAKSLVPQYLYYSDDDYDDYEDGKNGGYSPRSGQS